MVTSATAPAIAAAAVPGTARNANTKSAAKPVPNMASSGTSLSGSSIDSARTSPAMSGAAIVARISPL